MKVLSLFDGISCGQVALERAGIPIDRYVAYEIDKYAIQVSKNNYPHIEHRGDVVGADFREFTGFDLLIGGSPCQDLSIAAKDRKGLQGERSSLFYEFVRALEEVKPKYFLLENVASMTKENRKTISEALNVEPILINSALVSAQQRKRLYWTNIPVSELPQDKGIILQDILESSVALDKKAYTLTSSYGCAVFHDTITKKRRSMVAEPYILENASELATEAINCPKRKFNINPSGRGMNGNVYSIEGKSICLSAHGGGMGAKTGLYKIDLPDGDYITRKLTPVECERLQTLPDDYTAGISNSQRYRCLGNGWTIDVIAHIFKKIT